MPWLRKSPRSRRTAATLEKYLREVLQPHVLEHADAGRLVEAVASIAPGEFAVVEQFHPDAIGETERGDALAREPMLLRRQRDADRGHAVALRRMDHQARPIHSRRRAGARPAPAAACGRCDRAWRAAPRRASRRRCGSTHTSTPCVRRATAGRTHCRRRSGSGSPRGRSARSAARPHPRPAARRRSRPPRPGAPPAGALPAGRPAPRGGLARTPPRGWRTTGSPVQRAATARARPGGRARAARSRRARRPAAPPPEERRLRPPPAPRGARHPSAPRP